MKAFFNKKRSNFSMSIMVETANCAGRCSSRNKHWLWISPPVGKMEWFRWTYKVLPGGASYSGVRLFRQCGAPSTGYILKGVTGRRHRPVLMEGEGGGNNQTTVNCLLLCSVEQEDHYHRPANWPPADHLCACSCPNDPAADWCPSPGLGDLQGHHLSSQEQAKML